MFRTCRKCCCMNNSYNNENSCNAEKEMLESKCQDVYSYSVSKNLCDCGFDDDLNVFPENPMLAQSYVPIQYMNKTFKPNIGLKMGTIFPELVSPYVPCQSMEEINFIKQKNTIGKGCNQCM